MTSRLNLHTKLSFEPMFFRPYQAYMPRASLHSVDDKKTGSKPSLVACHVGQDDLAAIDFQAVPDVYAKVLFADI